MLLQQNCFQIQSETTSLQGEGKREKSMAANTTTTTTVDQKEN
jgi:hypothetical protein